MTSPQRSGAEIQLALTAFVARHGKRFALTWVEPKVNRAISAGERRYDPFAYLR